MTDEPLKDIGKDFNSTPEEFAFRSGVINKETETLAKMYFRKCYESIIELINEFIDVPDSYKKIISLWICATYLHKIFNTFPILYFNAMRGSGKTRTLKLTSTLAHGSDGTVLNNITEAVLFRNPMHSTLCLDELEQIGNKEKQSLRELLNCAYKKGTKVKRMKKVRDKGEELQVVESFEPYFPIAIANIKGLEEVLEDRAIQLILEKSDNPSITRMIENFDRDERFMNIKRTLSDVSDVLCRLCQENNLEKGWNKHILDKYNVTNNINVTNVIYNNNIYNNNKNTNKNDEKPMTFCDIINKASVDEEEKETRQKLTEEMKNLDFFNKFDSKGIYGRNFELVFPLAFTSNIMGEDVFNDTIDILADLVKEKKDEEYNDSRDVSLYEFVSQMPSDVFNFVPIKTLTMGFRQFIGDDDLDERWLNEKWFGKALRRLKLLLAKRRTSKTREVVLDVAKARTKIKMFKTSEHD